MDIIDKMNGVIESDEIVGANDVFAFFLLPSLIYNAIPGFPARMTVTEFMVVRLIPRVRVESCQAYWGGGASQLSYLCRYIHPSS